MDSLCDLNTSVPCRNNYSLGQTTDSQTRAPTNTYFNPSKMDMKSHDTTHGSDITAINLRLAPNPRSLTLNVNHEPHHKTSSSSGNVGHFPNQRNYNESSSGDTSEFSSVQGPNSQGYYGNYTRQEYTSHIPNIRGSTIDSYDNITTDQPFYGGYGEWGHVITRTERSILSDLKQYPFPDDIKNKADVIYNKMIYRVRRGKIRSQMLFFCVYCAHLELDRDVDPVDLGNLFGLSQGEVQRCDSIFSPLQTGYRPPSTDTSPLRYLPGYCQKMDLSEEAVEEITRLANNILMKDPDLRQENPQTVAAGILRYFTCTNGITTDDPQKLTKVTGRSSVTIDVMFRRIATIDNR